MKTFTAQERKERPVYSGVLRYFPKALLEIARVSYVGNEQHNPGAELHWDRSKSTDEADALVRHLLEAGTLDTDGLRHTAKAAWRCLSLLEKELEAAESLSRGDKPAKLRIAETGTHVPDSRTSNLAHDELYAASRLCAGGCGWRTYPETTCRKCRATAAARRTAKSRRGR